MWNKRSDESASPEMPNRPEAVPAAPVGARPAPAPTVSSGKMAVIGPSMHIKGDIVAQEELQVNGEVEGRVESQSMITVGPSGNVRATIRAHDLVIQGSLRGNVEVEGKITIRQQGSLVGDIKAAGITIDDGAYFKGSIDIVRPEPHITTKTIRSEPAPQKTAAG